MLGGLDLASSLDLDALGRASPPEQCEERCPRDRGVRVEREDEEGLNSRGGDVRRGIPGRRLERVGPEAFGGVGRRCLRSPGKRPSRLPVEADGTRRAAGTRRHLVSLPPCGFQICC